MNFKRFIGITLGIAAVASVGAPQANAQSFTTASLNAYSCSDATYGTSGTYFVSTNLYGSDRAVYT